MKILVAEDEPSISLQYKLVLEERGHQVSITNNGVDCLVVYTSAIGNSQFSSDRAKPSQRTSPFDVVILDYRMPKKDGLEAAKDILQLCPEQRIIFASAYVVETLRESAKTLHQIVELLQKPFGLDYLIEIVEDIGVYEQLARLNVKVRELKTQNLTLTELVDLLAGVKKLQATIIRGAR